MSNWHQIGEHLINVDEQSKMWVKDHETISHRNDRGDVYSIVCKDPKKEFQKLADKLTGRRSFMDTFKSYFKKHEEAYMTIFIVILIDHFIFAGVFRQKIQDLVDSLIAKTSRNLLEEDKPSRKKTQTKKEEPANGKTD